MKVEHEHSWQLGAHYSQFCLKLTLGTGLSGTLCLLGRKNLVQNRADCNKVAVHQLQQRKHVTLVAAIPFVLRSEKIQSLLDIDSFDEVVAVKICSCHFLATWARALLNHVNVGSSMH